MRFTSSPCRRLIGLLLAVVLIVCSIPSSTVKADLSLDASFQIACVFQNNFAVSYKCKIKTPGEFSNVRLNIEFEKYAAGSSSSTWEKTTIKDYTYDSSTGEYAFTFRGISAAELGNKVKASLSADKDGQTYTSSTKSVTLKQYAMYLLNANQDNTDEVSKKLCALLVDMLNYGALTQAYFNVNAANPVNNQLTDAQQALGAGMVENPVSCYSMAALSGSTVSIKNVALVFGSTVDLAVFASFNGKPSSSAYAEITYTGIDGKEIVHKVTSDRFIKQDDGTYRATFTGISSLYFRTPFKLVYKNGDNAVSGTLTYSYESYTNAVVAADVPQSIKDGVRYMLGFGDSAKKYFQAVNHSGGDEPAGEYLTYSMFGAKGDGVTDDYAAIVATHEAANERNLPVKADPGATYYVHNMTSYKGAIIKTDTDWSDATFIIDDRGITLDEGEYFLFTVAPYKDVERRWVPGGVSWKQKPNGTWYFKKDVDIEKDGDTGFIKIRIGLDPNLDQYPLYNSYSAATALNHRNKYIEKGQTQLDIGDTGGFSERALYLIEDFKQRWGRNGSSVSSAPTRNQQEIIIVNEDGSVDPVTPIQYPYDDDIYMIDKCFIDDTTLTITGGKFITINNTINSRHYIHRGIHVTRSNTVIDGVEHEIRGENAQFTDTSYYEVKDKEGNITATGYHARLGAPYHGFITVDHCAFVTCRNCVFANHLCVYGNGNDTERTAPYDYYAEFAAALTLENCTCAPAKLFYFDYCKAIAEGTELPEERYDEKGIFDTARWGTTATNFCKTITVDGCSLNRVDAHMGAYNITIKDTEIGILGIDVIGFGDLYIEGVTNYADRFLNLRGDFGSYWEGDVTIKDCYWDIGGHYNAFIVFADYITNPKNPFGHEIITEDGVDYYSTLPTTITIDGFTVDARNMPAGGSQTYFYKAGVMVFSCPFSKPQYGPSGCVDEDWLANRDLYKYPLRAPKEINVSRFQVLRSDTAQDEVFTNGALNIRNDKLDTVHDLYFFHDTAFNCDKSVEQGILEEDPEGTKNAVPESAGTRNAAPENAETENAVTEDAVTEDALTENAVTEDAVTENEAAENAAAENEVTEGAGTENTVTENAVTENAGT